MDGYRMMRSFAEYQGVPSTGAGAWDRLGEHAFKNPYEDFGSMPRSQPLDAATAEKRLYGDSERKYGYEPRPYGPSSGGFGYAARDMAAYRPLNEGRRGRFGQQQGLMGKGNRLQQRDQKKYVIRRQSNNYPYTPVPDSIENKSIPITANGLFCFHGYQSLFTLQHRFDFIVEGQTYKSVDQFYQMNKVKDLTGLNSVKFTDGSTRNYSSLAKDLLRQAGVSRSKVDNWRITAGVEVIQKALLEKVRQCHDLRSAITSTAEKLIVHSYNGDDFFGSGCPAKYVKDWGAGMEKNEVSMKYPMAFPLTADNVKYVPTLAKGKNVLGAIYMILRERINSGQLDSLVVDAGNMSSEGNKPATSSVESMSVDFTSDSNS